MEDKLQVYVDSQVAQISPYKAKSNALLQDAELLDVTDAKTAKEAAALRKQITAHKKLVGDARKDITRQLDDVKKQFIKAEKDVLEPADEAQEVVQKKLVEFEEAEAKRRAAEEKRIAEICAKFEAGTDGLETPEEVETQLGVLENTLSSLAPEDRANPQVKLAYNEAKSALLQHMDELTLGTETDEADMVNASAELNDAVEEAKTAEKVAAKAEPKLGLKTKTQFEITDPDMVPRTLCEPSEKLIRAAIKNGVTRISGVKIWEERGF